MSNYSIDSRLQKAYERFPEAECRPVIGITANHTDIDATVREYYHKQVVAAGGIPVIIPPVDDVDTIIGTLGVIDGIILTGGADYNPLWCGEEPERGLHHINAARDAAELTTTRLAYNRQIPMLGICRGIQTLAMAFGGHVCQDIKGDDIIKHSQDAATSEPTHSVMVAKDSALYNIYKEERLYVNSFHHQAVDYAGDRFTVTACAADGVIEAMESVEYKSIMGVQWHPECMGEDGLPLFQWLVEKAREYREACRVHEKVLTLDTHCDTPMFFHHDVDFLKRDDRILVDLHKMTEGRQDATTMVAYLPQTAPGEAFASKIEKPSDMSEEEAKALTPFSYANYVFDRIEETVSRKPEYVGIARTAADLYANKAMGRKSIMLGIENGLALEHSLDNLRHFADRGIVYMTLCHNGDNDICDSARGINTHNGVSAFGEEVIREMNRLGIMVDMSHAAEKSFYDALEISEKPIVCSHSNCRALCDHPRNLTDDQLRALAAKGGVAHTTFYHGFLREPGEADILDGIAHLEHAIRIMGIDHVGIGTDFDGDGGVRGMASSSDVIQFTMQLLRRRYSLSDIEKIWGGNWLRVLAP